MDDDDEHPDYDAHEALDRLHIVLGICEDHLLAHPHIKARADVRRLVRKAASSLVQAYQIIGKEHVP